MAITMQRAEITMQRAEIPLPLAYLASAFYMSREEVVSMFRMGNESWGGHERGYLRCVPWEINGHKYKFTWQGGQKYWDGYLVPDDNRVYIPKPPSRSKKSRRKSLKKYPVFFRLLTQYRVKFPFSRDIGTGRSATINGMREAVNSCPVIIVGDISQLTIDKPTIYYYLIDRTYLLTEIDAGRLPTKGWTPEQFYDFLYYNDPNLLPEELISQQDYLPV